MIRQSLQRRLVRIVFSVFAALVLYGTVNSGDLALIPVLLVLLRAYVLVEEGMRKPMSEEQRRLYLLKWADRYTGLSANERQKVAKLIGCDIKSSPENLAQARLAKELHDTPPSRAWLDLGAEILGVVTFVLLIPVTIALFTREFISLDTGEDWNGLLVITICLVLYIWPLYWRQTPGWVGFRKLWWAIPFLPVLIAFAIGIETRHPYLNPLRPDRTRLAAERVVGMWNTVVAARQVDWVLHYAQELEKQGNISLAARYYQETLRLDSTNTLARERWLAVNPSLLPASPVSPHQPYWENADTLARAPRRAIDEELLKVEKCTVVIVTVGHVPDRLVDAVAHTVTQELKLLVYVRSGEIPLPKPTRFHGLITGQQWRVGTVLETFMNFGDPLPNAPLRYLVLTPADIYEDGTNYLFSASWEEACVVSYARYGDPRDELCLYRTAKQSLCALLKCFHVPISTDRDCVTSYVRSLDEFDRKGNRPKEEARSVFERGLVQLNANWEQRSRR